MYKVYCKGNKNSKWQEYSSEFKTLEQAEECKKRAEERMICNTNGNLIKYKIVAERSPEQIAIDIFTGDVKAKAELEKMMGKKFDDMTITERRLGVTCLAAFEEQWNK